MIKELLIAAGLVSVAVLAWIVSSREITPRGIVLAIGRKTPKTMRDNYAERLELLDTKVEPDLIAGLRHAGLIIFLFAAFTAYTLYGLKLAGFFMILAILAWIYPENWLAKKEKERIADLEREFPLMVTLVRVYARASDLYKALNIVRGALRGELKRQMDILASELTIYPLKTALENFSARCQYPPVTNFVSVVLFGITTGTNVDNILESFSKRTYQSRVNDIKRKIKTQPILISVLPAMMMMGLLLLFVFPMYANIIDKLRAF